MHCVHSRIQCVYNQAQYRLLLLLIPSGTIHSLLSTSYSLLFQDLVCVWYHRVIQTVLNGEKLKKTNSCLFSPRVNKNNNLMCASKTRAQRSGISLSLKKQIFFSVSYKIASDCCYTQALLAFSLSIRTSSCPTNNFDPRIVPVSYIYQREI